MNCHEAEVGAINADRNKRIMFWPYPRSSAFIRGQ
jgi:hypothetical protein